MIFIVQHPLKKNTQQINKRKNTNGKSKCSCSMIDQTLFQIIVLKNALQI